LRKKSKFIEKLEARFDMLFSVNHALKPISAKAAMYDNKHQRLFDQWLSRNPLSRKPGILIYFY
jgi:hypothetical protein